MREGTAVFRSILMTMLAALMALSGVAHADDKDNEIDLRLFGKSTTDPWDGCRFALWQKNRNPDEDEFAYVFYAPIPDGEALPAWVKIGETIVEVDQIDTGAADTGNLAPVLVYRNAESDLTVIVDILEQKRVDAGIEIVDSRLTFVIDKKFPFAVRATGLNGCPSAPGAAEQTPATGNAPEVAVGPMKPFDGLGSVPRMVLNAIADNAPGCAPENTPGFGATYSVNDALTLWQVPCNLYAAAGSSVFVLSDETYATVLYFPMPPGSGMNDEAEMLNAEVEPATATVTSFSLDTGGDCGTFTRHQLRPEEGEQLLFAMTEYREKMDCDGRPDDPATFPLVYSAP